MDLALRENQLPLKAHIIGSKRDPPKMHFLTSKLSFVIIFFLFLISVGRPWNLNPNLGVKNTLNTKTHKKFTGLSSYSVGIYSNTVVSQLLAGHAALDN